MYALMTGHKKNIGNVIYYERQSERLGERQSVALGEVMAIVDEGDESTPFCDVALVRINDGSDSVDVNRVRCHLSHCGREFLESSLAGEIDELDDYVAENRKVRKFRCRMECSSECTVGIVDSFVGVLDVPQLEGPASYAAVRPCPDDLLPRWTDRHHPAADLGETRTLEAVKGVAVQVRSRYF
jgi:hypothetical protein